MNQFKSLKKCGCLTHCNCPLDLPIEERQEETPPKLTVDELDKNDVDWKAILKKEGDSPCSEPQFKEWWDIFHLTMMCEKAGLSELEKWCVLRGRFKIIRK